MRFNIFSDRHSGPERRPPTLPGSLPVPQSRPRARRRATRGRPAAPAPLPATPPAAESGDYLTTCRLTQAGSWSRPRPVRLFDHLVARASSVGAPRCGVSGMMPANGNPAAICSVWLPVHHHSRLLRRCPRFRPRVQSPRRCLPSTRLILEPPHRLCRHSGHACEPSPAPSKNRARHPTLNREN
jgi:hypothetical protein